MKMKQFGKKLTATLLSAAMVFTMGTTAAFAEGTVPDSVWNTAIVDSETDAAKLINDLKAALGTRTDYELVSKTDAVKVEDGAPTASTQSFDGITDPEAKKAELETETAAEKVTVTGYTQNSKSSTVTGKGNSEDEAKKDAAAKANGKELTFTDVVNSLTVETATPGKVTALTGVVPKNSSNYVILNLSSHKFLSSGTNATVVWTRSRLSDTEINTLLSKTNADAYVSGTESLGTICKDFIIYVASIGEQGKGTYQFTVTPNGLFDVDLSISYGGFSTWTATGTYEELVPGSYTFNLSTQKYKTQYKVSYCYKNTKTGEYVKVLPDPPAEHKHTLSGWLTDSTHHWKECTDPNCPDKEYNIVYIQDKDEHVDKNSDGKCDTCGYKVPVTPPAHTKHTYTLKKDDLYHWYACTGCTATYGKALHTYGAWTITKYPTTYTKGTASHTCTICGHVETIRFRYGEYIPGYPYWPDYDNGGKLNGWKELSKGTVYYENGVKLTGWQKIDGETYYFDEDGYLCYGWLKLSGKWYYLDPHTGARQYGWLRVKNTWYYLTPGTGVMYANGEYNIDGVRYYFFDWGGMMETNWLDAPEGWKYFRGNGAMAKSAWIEWKGEYYYVASDGVMLTDAYTPDGYYVNKDGVWVH